ncbi:hypothetical protein ACVWWG_007201 [Bradyrhizobium sp. LB7.2]
MAQLVANCPRCGADKMTFDVENSVNVGTKHGWQRWFEIFSICRNCHRPTIYRVSQNKPAWDNQGPAFRNAPEKFQDSLSPHFEIEGFVNLSDRANVEAPEHTPPLIAEVFREAASSIAVNNWNAAGAMFRLAINLATQPLLPPGSMPGLTRRKRRDLGPRVEWLMQNGLISKDLFDLSECIREDGNDGAHDGTLKKEDAADLLDFTAALFERMFTEPERLRLAKERRDKRRGAVEVEEA